MLKTVSETLLFTAIHAKWADALPNDDSAHFSNSALRANDSDTTRTVLTTRRSRLSQPAYVPSIAVQFRRIATSHDASSTCETESPTFFSSRRGRGLGSGEYSLGQVDFKGRNSTWRKHGKINAERVNFTFLIVILGKVVNL